MKRILIGSIAAITLATGIGAANAADPGEEQLYRDRYGVFSMTPDDPYAPAPNAPQAAPSGAYFSGPLGYAPSQDYDYED